MDVKSIGSSRKIVNLYSDNKKVVSKEKIEGRKDSIEISSLAKGLRNMDIDDINIDNTKKIEAIKINLDNGTYKPNSRTLAKSIWDNMKGRNL